MTKEQVIQIRDAIKAGKNLPLKLFITDVTTDVNEANALTAVKWDDVNGIIYVYRLEAMSLMSSPSDRTKTISLYATTYENITGMEVGKLPVEDIRTTSSNIRSTGATFSEDFENWVYDMFNNALSSDRVRLEHYDVNQLTGARVDTTYGSYYHDRQKGKMKLEQRYADRNEKIDKGELVADEGYVPDSPDSNG